jgi:hypothetical protein
MARTALIERVFSFGPDGAGDDEVAIFDSTISEDHSFEIAIPDDPVETGVSLSDHAYAKPRPLRMEVAVSDAPLQERGIPVADEDGTPSVELAKLWTNGGDTRRSVYAWGYIVDKAAKFAIFDVQTGLESYQNMMFVRGSASVTKDTAGCLRASLEMKQVTFASTVEVQYLHRPAQPKTKRAAAKKSDDGKKVAEDAPPAAKKAASTLSELTGLKPRGP